MNEFRKLQDLVEREGIKKVVLVTRSGVGSSGRHSFGHQAALTYQALQENGIEGICLSDEALSHIVTRSSEPYEQWNEFRNDDLYRLYCRGGLTDHAAVKYGGYQRGRGINDVLNSFGSNADSLRSMADYGIIAETHQVTVTEIERCHVRSISYVERAAQQLSQVFGKRCVVTVPEFVANQYVANLPQSPIIPPEKIVFL